MLRFSILLCSLFILCTQLYAQIVISPNISFDAQYQTHILTTQKGDEFIGQIDEIVNDSLSFKISRLDTVLHFGLAEIDFLGLTGETKLDFLPTTNESAAENRPIPYIYTAPAISKHKKVAYKNTLLALNEFDFNIGQHFVVGAGALVPFALKSRFQFNYSINKMLHFGLSNQNIFTVSHVHDGFHLSYNYCMLTLGNDNRFINLATGYMSRLSLKHDFRFKGFKNNEPSVSLTVFFKSKGNWSVFSENLIIFKTNKKRFFPSVNFSKQVQGSTISVSIIPLLFDADIPFIPLMSYSLVI